MNRDRACLLIPVLLWCGALARWTAAAQAAPEPPPKAPGGFFQVMTPAFSIECNVSKEYTDKVARMVGSAEQRFYQMFKLTPDLMNGVSKQKFDSKGNIPGDVLKFFRPYIGVRVYKDMESFSDEWFEQTGVKDKQQRLRQGIPGAWFSIHPDYDKKRTVREIRTFVSNRDDDELERTLLHEMGHLFMQSYLLEFGGSPPPGQEAQKRGTPAWLGEGVAQLFENLWSNARSATKARLRQQVFAYEATQAGDSYPFDEFANVTNAHNLAAVAGDPLRMTLNYAQSFSVMEYMLNVDGARFFAFLENLRAMNFEKNLRSRDANHIPELYSFQNEAFKKAFNCELKDVEAYWKKHIKTTIEAQLKKQPELYYFSGEYYLRRGKDKATDMVKAEEKFKLAMTLAPTRGEGYLGMGHMALRKKDYENAASLLTKATQLLPKDDDAWYLLGVAQVNAGKLKEATESLAQSLKIFPRNHRALSGLGQAQFHAAQYAKAAESFEQAYQVSHDPTYLMEKGRAAFFGKDYKLSQNGFAVFCDVFPNDSQGLLWYGLAAWRLNDKEFAMQKLKKAASLNPNDPLIKETVRLAEKGETVRFELETAPAAAAAEDAGKPAAGKPKTTFVRIEDE
ncbi:MAG: tetratricopeptide repeat protein [Planctomycetota bacterium]|nr:tetratricopeptide repeat protein [Planctomycetota bacterium]